MANIDLTDMDSRVILYHARRGDISFKDFEAHKATRPDDAEFGVESEIQFMAHVAERQAKNAEE